MHRSLPITLKRMSRIAITIAIGTLVKMCVEPFEVETQDFEKALVVDATITDELKRQQILLSRTFLLKEFDPVAEENAMVKIIDDLQNEYLFQEVEPGRYESVDVFGAESNRGYQLIITLQNGNSYSSELERLSSTNLIDSLSVTRTKNENDEEGISISVMFGSSTDPLYYRYEYEEAYKIIAPQWKGERLIFSSSGEAFIFPIEREERVCYAEAVSSGIILGSSFGPTGDPKNSFEVRFIDRNNTIISHRYSILVKQFEISKQAYDYLELLKRFSGQGNLLSQTQPGFFDSNVHFDGEGDQRVLGFFDISAVSTRRIFLDYIDYFPDEELPPYVDEDCSPYVAGPGTNPTLSYLLNNNLVRYYSTDPLSGNISVVPRICADCTLLGDTEVPEFWEE